MEQSWHGSRPSRRPNRAARRFLPIHQHFGRISLHRCERSWRGECPPGVEAEDLLQDVFLRVTRNLNTLRATDRPEAWLFQIARNALRDSLRARQRRDGKTDTLEIDLPAETDTAALRAAEVALAPCLTSMITRLAEPYRSAIELTSLRGLTQAEAARQVGISISGMKSRVQRGREQLRQMLVRCCEIAVDARGGVSDFHLRFAGACTAGRESVDGPPVADKPSRSSAPTGSQCGSSPATCTAKDGHATRRH